MRTDPRASEVRTIVKGVFARFLQSGERSTQPVIWSDDRTEWEAPSRPVNRFASEPKFPRLYQPEVDTIEQASYAEETFETLDIDETIVVDRGRYMARTYRTAGLMAMWLVPVGIVQFYDDAGQMLGTINLFRTLRPERMAS
jgi:hypothetical protein